MISGQNKLIYDGTLSKFKSIFTNRYISKFISQMKKPLFKTEYSDTSSQYLSVNVWSCNKHDQNVELIAICSSTYTVLKTITSYWRHVAGVDKLQRKKRRASGCTLVNTDSEDEPENRLYNADTKKWDSMALARYAFKCWKCYSRPLNDVCSEHNLQYNSKIEINEKIKLVNNKSISFSVETETNSIDKFDFPSRHSSITSDTSPTAISHPCVLPIHMINYECLENDCVPDHDSTSSCLIQIARQTYHHYHNCSLHPHQQEQYYQKCSCAIPIKGTLSTLTNIDLKDGYFFADFILDPYIFTEKQVTMVIISGTILMFCYTPESTLTATEFKDNNANFRRPCCKHDACSVHQQVGKSLPVCDCRVVSLPIYTDCRNVTFVQINHYTIKIICKMK